MKAYLFDFNGTLFNDTRFHIDAWREFAAQRFQLYLPDAEVERRFIGPDNFDIFRSLMGEDYDEAQAARYSEEKEKNYRDAVLADEKNKALVKGAEQMLDMLTERGIPFALATASVRSNVDFYLNDLGLSRWFTLDRVVYSDGKRRPKPAPDYYLEAAKRLGFDPKDCTVAEDTLTGVLSARAAGVGRIIASRQDGAFDKIGPYASACISDFTDFEKFLI